MQKALKRTLLLSACILGLSTAHATNVNAESLKEKISGLFSKTEGDGVLKPHETLRAPFDTDGQLNNSKKDSLMFLYDKELTGNNDGNILARAHRTDAQMSEWAMAVVTNLLSFDYREAQGHINKYQVLFDRPALHQYIESINKSDIVRAMKQNGWISVAMFEDMPLVQNKANFQGSYRWTFDFPVSVTFRDTRRNAPKDASLRTIVMNIKMRAARVSPEKGLDGVVLESWAMERIK
tara:strand:- start:14293 stop:15003 length:711 start_codon:yes stop_codon:yes gene_type:complete